MRDLESIFEEEIFYTRRINCLNRFDFHRKIESDGTALFKFEGYRSARFLLDSRQLRSVNSFVALELGSPSRIGNVGPYLKYTLSGFSNLLLLLSISPAFLPVH